MFLGESDAFQTRECNIQLVIYALPHFLSNRQNGINNWSTKGQHLLLSGFVEKVERGGQDGECFLLSFQHLFSSGHGDDGSWRKHSQPDVRGTTHARARTHTHTHTHTDTNSTNEQYKSYSSHGNTPIKTRCSFRHTHTWSVSSTWCNVITKMLRQNNKKQPWVQFSVHRVRRFWNISVEYFTAGQSEVWQEKRARTHIDYSHWVTS